MFDWLALCYTKWITHYVTNTISAAWCTHITVYSGKIVLQSERRKKNTHTRRSLGRPNNIATIERVYCRWVYWCAIVAKGVVNRRKPQHIHAVAATLRGGMCLCHLWTPKDTRATTTTLGDNSSSWAWLVWIDPKLLDRQRHTHIYTYTKQARTLRAILAAQARTKGLFYGLRAHGRTVCDNLVINIAQGCVRKRNLPSTYAHMHVYVIVISRTSGNTNTTWPSNMCVRERKKRRTETNAQICCRLHEMCMCAYVFEYECIFHFHTTAHKWIWPACCAVTFCVRCCPNHSELIPCSGWPGKNANTPSLSKIAKLFTLLRRLIKTCRWVLLLSLRWHCVCTWFVDRSQGDDQQKKYTQSGADVDIWVGGDAQTSHLMVTCCILSVIMPRCDIHRHAHLHHHHYH